MPTMKTMIRLRECVGWFESSLGAYVKRYVLSRCGYFIVVVKRWLNKIRRCAWKMKQQSLLHAFIQHCFLKLKRGLATPGRSSRNLRGLATPGRSSRNLRGLATPGRSSRNFRGLATPGRSSRNLRGLATPGRSSRNLRGLATPGRSSREHAYIILTHLNPTFIQKTEVYRGIH